MNKKWLWIVLPMLALASCKKYESPSSGGGTPLPTHQDPVYHIGDYFRNDTLEGVVFFTYGDHNGLMVSLEETYLPWCVPSHINSQTGATNPYDGWNNTNILMSNYDLRNYPVIQWSHQRNTWNLVYYYYYQVTSKQWYVPASSELRYLLLNQKIVNATLDSLGYPTLEDKTYWSSTELGTRSAASLRMQDSSLVVTESLKDKVFYVRAVRNY